MDNSDDPEVTGGVTSVPFLRDYRAGAFVGLVLHDVAEGLAASLPGKLRAVTASFLGVCATEAARRATVTKDTPLLHGRLFEIFDAQLPLLVRDRRLLDVDSRTRTNVANQLHRVLSHLRGNTFDVTDDPLARCTYRIVIPEVQKGRREEVYEVFLEATVHVGALEDVLRIMALRVLYELLPEDYVELLVPLDMLGPNHVPLLHELVADKTIEGFARVVTLLQSVVDALWPIERWQFLNDLFRLDVPEEMLRLASFDWGYLWAAHESLLETAGVINATRCLTLLEKLIALDVAKQCGREAVAPLTDMLLATVTRASRLPCVAEDDAVRDAVAALAERSAHVVEGLKKLQGSKVEFGVRPPPD